MSDYTYNMPDVEMGPPEFRLIDDSENYYIKNINEENILTVSKTLLEDWQAFHMANDAINWLHKNYVPSHDPNKVGRVAMSRF